tara:strand:+ start:5037 stop:5756 length:720 start_codon:yes stop_codon:yes gene_type:complete
MFEPDWEKLAGKQLAYIRVPKTASTSAVEMIRINSLKIRYTTTHRNYDHLVENWDWHGIADETTPPERARDYDMAWVAVIRNPYDWITSFYEHHSRGRGIGKEVVNIGMWKSFEQFVDLICDTETINFMQPHNWIHEQIYSGNKCMPQILIRYEKVNEGWDKIIDEFDLDTHTGAKVRLGRVNVNRHHTSGYKKYYNDKLIEKMEARWGNELLSLGYTIDGPIDDSIFVDPEQCHRRVQ